MSERDQSRNTERRQFYRLTGKLSAKITCRNGVIRARSVDVSQGGVFFLAEMLPDESEEVLVEMRLPGTAEPMSMRARIVRRREESMLYAPGFGVQFLDFTPAEEKSFINYLKILRELSGLTKTSV